MTIATKAQLQQLRSRLEADKQEIQHRIDSNDHHGLESSLRENTGELSPIDNHPGDLGSEMFERGKDIALLEQEELHLARITAAIDAINNNTYGRCVTCGEPIPFQRLDALPDSLYCIEHAPRQEISDRRPVEEEVLIHPYGRTSLDDNEELTVGFDGEDAWQVVEQWGNADSPAMSENVRVNDYNHVGIEADENDGFVEPLESFLATDITGRFVTVIRNQQYRDYMESGEGDHLLETDNELE